MFLLAAALAFAAVRKVGERQLRMFSYVLLQLLRGKPYSLFWYQKRFS